MALLMPRTEAESMPGFPLGSLPEDCLSVVFSLCSPREICQFACVSPAWRAAAGTDQAWSRISPWTESVGETFPALTGKTSPCALFSLAVKGVYSEDGAFMLSADRDTGLLSLHMSVVRNMGICWLDKNRDAEHWGSRNIDGAYWTTTMGVPGASFPTCAHLRNVCWFEIKGSVDFPPPPPPPMAHGSEPPSFALPAGQYSVSWKVAGEHDTFRWTDSAALSSITDTSGRVLVQDCPVDFKSRGQPFQSRFPDLDDPRNRKRLHINDFRSPRTWNMEVPIHDRDQDQDLERMRRFVPRQPLRPGRVHVRPVMGLGRGIMGLNPRESDLPAPAVEPQPTAPEDDDEYMVWELHTVGVVSLEGSKDKDGSGGFHANVSLVETQDGDWKSGLFVDSLILTQLPHSGEETDVNIP